jgi:hypothetical protein
MTAKRPPPPDSEPQPTLPHDNDRESGQPYAKEVEDYGRGVATPPEEQTQKTSRTGTHNSHGETNESHGE